uniref:Alsin-like n=1 Tax=Saccoglossus kowalevskii TaxID=10224 RepID=A0ABM0MJF5_SACKO|nr:PREDICTED: alsin-like [Saccoglossus kowalevskii]
MEGSLSSSMDSMQHKAWIADVSPSADDMTLQTEVWSWGKGNLGQLGQGDLLDRIQPTLIKTLSAKNIIRVASGSAHSIVLSSSGQVYSWGSNNDGQLGHTGQLAPKRVKVPSNVPVWDIAAGTNHTLLLADGQSYQPEIYYIGRQPGLQELQSFIRPATPDKDAVKRRSTIPKGPTVKYVPRVKQPERLQFVRRLGWVRSIAAAGDQCACIVDKNSSGFVSILHEFASTERMFYQQLVTLKGQIFKSLLSTEFFKPLESSVYGPPLKEIADAFGVISNIVGRNSIQITAVVQNNQDLFDLSILSNYKESIEAFDRYGSYFANLTAIAVFQHIGTNLGEFLAKHDTLLNELVGEEEKQPNTVAAFHYVLLSPVKRIKEYSRLIGQIMQHFSHNTVEHSQLREVGSTWETLKNVIQIRLGDAEKTKAFWEGCPPKLAEQLKTPDRRIIRDSKTFTLNLASASRFSSNCKLSQLADNELFQLVESKLFQLADIKLFQLADIKLFHLADIKLFHLADIKQFQLADSKLLQLADSELFQLADIKLFQLADIKLFQLADSKLFQLVDSKLFQLVDSKLFQLADGKLFQLADSKLFQLADSKLLQLADSELFQLADSILFQLADGKLFQLADSKLFQLADSKLFQLADIELFKLTDSKLFQLVDIKLFQLADSKLSQLVDSILFQLADSKLFQLADSKLFQLADGKLFQLADGKLFQLADSILFQLPDGKLFQVADSILFQLADSILFQLADGKLFQLADGKLFQLADSILFQLADSKLFQLADSKLFQLADSMFQFSASFSSHLSYPLATVWAEAVPDSDQAQHAIQLNMPEASLLVSAPSSAHKKEWLWAINQAIDTILTNQKKEQKKDSTVPVITPPPAQQKTGVVPPLTRHGKHVFQSGSKYKDATYDGLWLSGKPHGKGIMVWPDGSKYTGKYILGLQQGHGMYIIPASEAGKSDYMYDGQWLEGKMHGAGILRYHNGDIYEGYFKENQRHGHGMLRCGSLTSSAPSVYIGEWVNDKRYGYGVMDDINRGEKYMGMWQDDYRHGNALVVTLDGVYYEGTFMHNKLSGVGLLVTEDGTCYEGELATGPTLNGKGVLRLPNGDFIEGTFTGLWGDGIKVNGNFNKAPLETPDSARVTSGQYVVEAENKWEEIFTHCKSTLGCHDKIVPSPHKAWEAVAVALSAGKRGQLANSNDVQSKEGAGSIDRLERIPVYDMDTISDEDYVAIQNYLEKAFEVALHPLGQLVASLVDVYRATYVGIGANRILLTYAVSEIKSYVTRLYKILRILFPGLPSEETEVKPSQSPTRENPYGYSSMHGYAGMQLSPVEKNDEKKLHITSAGLLHPVLLPRLYPPLFTLYALQNENLDDKYWERILRLNKQSDIALMAYLGVNLKFWLFDDSAVSTTKKTLSETKDECYTDAVETLQQISTTFSPSEKLRILRQTFETINQSVENSLKEEHMWSMDDLFPMFQYVVVRARIRHLGSEIHLVDDLMEPHLANGELGLMFTTLKACYFQIQNEKVAF